MGKPIVMTPEQIAAITERKRRQAAKQLAARRAKLLAPKPSPTTTTQPSTVGGLVKSEFQSKTYGG